MNEQRTDTILQRNLCENEFESSPYWRVEHACRRHNRSDGHSDLAAEKEQLNEGRILPHFGLNKNPILQTGYKQESYTMKYDYKPKCHDVTRNLHLPMTNTINQGKQSDASAKETPKHQHVNIAICPLTVTDTINSTEINWKPSRRCYRDTHQPNRLVL